MRKKVLVIQVRYRNLPEITPFFQRKFLATQQARRRAYNFLMQMKHNFSILITVLWSILKFGIKHVLFIELKFVEDCL